MDDTRRLITALLRKGFTKEALIGLICDRIILNECEIQNWLSREWRRRSLVALSKMQEEARRIDDLTDNPEAWLAAHRRWEKHYDKLHQATRWQYQMKKTVHQIFRGKQSK